MRSQALAGLLRRIEQTGRIASGRFPVFADPRSGEWTWSDDGAWSSGFWPGMLWLAAAATGERRFAALAAESAQRLRSQGGTPTVLRGLVFWYGAGIAAVLDPARHAQAELAIAAARSLAAGFDPAARLLPPGAQDARLYRWPRPGACIDGLPGAVPLLAFAAARTGDGRLRDIALAHARGHLALCLRADGSAAQSATYDHHGRLRGQACIEGSSRDSTRARAQAWAMLGLAQAAHLAGNEFTQPAKRAAGWYLDHLPADGVCFWDFDDPAIPDAPPRHLSGGHHRRRAAEAGRARRGPVPRSRPAHHRRPGSPPPRCPRGLRDGCYEQRNGLATSNELIWGDYFLLETLLALDNVITPGTL